MIRIEIEQTGARRYRKEPADAVRLARRMLDETRQAGVRVPRARFVVAGEVVRGGVTRTDIARDLGVCWCGRGALRVADGVPFCCVPHEFFWGRWGDDLRARTIVARFLAIYSRRGRR